jgi:uncharacterized paraquat-inducible protein A
MDRGHQLDPSASVHLPLITCVRCKMIWLAPGIAGGDSYGCKRCGVTFIVGGPDLSVVGFAVLVTLVAVITKLVGR